MTTLHTDDVRNIPDRILNMLETRVDADRLENDIYQAMDVGVLIRKKRTGPVRCTVILTRYVFDREGQKQNYYGSDRWKTGAERISGIAVAAV